MVAQNRRKTVNNFWLQFRKTLLAMEQMEIVSESSDDDVDLQQSVPSLLLDISLDAIKYILSWCTENDIAKFSVISRESYSIAAKC